MCVKVCICFVVVVVVFVCVFFCCFFFFFWGGGGVLLFIVNFTKMYCFVVMAIKADDAMTTCALKYNHYQNP